MGDLWRALGYLRQYWRTTLGAFLSLLLITLTNLISPQVLGAVIDRGISPRNLAAILYLSLVFLAIAIIRDVFTFTQG